MGLILDPDMHGKYFDEIRDLISPDHSLTAEDLPNQKIDQYPFLGRAEAQVLEMTGRSAGSFRPDNENPFASPDKDELYSIQLRTALSMLEPQVLSEQQFSSRVTYQEWDLETRKAQLTEAVAAVDPGITVPGAGVGVGGVIRVERVRGTF